MPGEEPLSHSIELLDKLEEQAPRDNVRLMAAISVLRQALTSDVREREEAQRLLAE